MAAFLNEAVRIDGSFAVGGEETDVDDLTVTVRQPDGTDVEYTDPDIVHDATGEYHAVHIAVQLGTHAWRWVGGEPDSTVVLEGEFFVRESLFDAPEDWLPITGAEVGAQSQVDFESLGMDGVRLQTAVEVSVAWISWATGRRLDSTLPVELQPLGREAVRQRVELYAFRSSSDNVQTAGTEGISSLSVGGISLSFRDPGGSSAKSSGGIPAITPWSALNETLWALMTDAKREEWLTNFAGGFPPAFAVTEPDFSWPTESSHGVRTSDFPWQPFADWPTDPGWD